MTDDDSAARRRDLVARALKLARKRYGTMREFANDLRREIGWSSLSMAAVYAWEAGTTRIPAVALVAAANMSRLSIDALLAAAANGTEEGASLPGGVDARLRKLEERIDRVESRLPR